MYSYYFIVYTLYIKKNKNKKNKYKILKYS